MSKIKEFFMIEDRNIRNLVKTDRQESTRLETYKIMGQ